MTVLLVVLLGELIGFLVVNGRILVVAHIIVQESLPPVEGGHGGTALLGVIYLDGVVDGLDGVCPLALAPKEPGAQDECIHVIRRLAELLVHELQGLGLVVLLFQDLVGLGEVVSVLGGFLLGVGDDAQGCQYDY